METQRKLRKTAIVFGSFILHLLSMGVAQSFGVIYKELLTVFEVGESEIGWVASLFTGLLLGTGLISGILISLVGVFLTSVAGSLLMTIGMVASAFVSSPYLLYVTYGVIAGCGASLLMIGATVIINLEFTNRPTVAMGIASSGGSIGNIVLPLYTLWCIEFYDWRGAFILLGGLCLQGVVASFLLYDKGKKAVRESVKEADNTGPLIRSPFNRCAKFFSFFNRRYINFIVASTICLVGFFIPYNILYSMMALKGQTKEHSSLALSLAGVGSILARILVGFLGDYKCCNRIYYFIFSMSFCAVINVVCVHLTVFWHFLIYGFLYGMGTGVFALLLPILTADLAGMEHIGPAVGFMATMHGLAASIGTPAGGWLVEGTSSYDSSFYFSGACFMIGAFLCAIIPLSWHCLSPGSKPDCSTRVSSKVLSRIETLKAESSDPSQFRKY